MTCPNCDNPNPDGARFCISCGSALQTTKVLAHGAVPLRETVRLPNRRPVGTDGLSGLTIDGKYLLEQKISTGGLGTLYRATRLMIGDAALVKVLALAPTVDPVAVERLRREARALARLQHPNIVAIYDFGISADGLAYLVQELVEGE